MEDKKAGSGSPPRVSVQDRLVRRGRPPAHCRHGEDVSVEDYPYPSIASVKSQMNGVERVHSLGVGKLSDAV